MDKIVQLIILTLVWFVDSTNDLTILSGLDATILYRNPMSSESFVGKTILLLEWHGVCSYYVHVVPHSSVLHLPFDSLGKTTKHKSANKNKS